MCVWELVEVKVIGGAREGAVGERVEGCVACTPIGVLVAHGFPGCVIVEDLAPAVGDLGGADEGFRIVHVFENLLEANESVKCMWARVCMEKRGL